jgi:hypothetical protein
MRMLILAVERPPMKAAISSEIDFNSIRLCWRRPKFDPLVRLVPTEI